MPGGNLAVSGVPYFVPRSPNPIGSLLPSSGYPQNSKDVKLFQPLTIRGRTLKNRVVVSPMCQFSAKDGMFSDWHLVHLGAFAVRGAALVFTEETAVSPEGRISPEDTGIYSDDQIPGLRRVADFIHSQESLFGVQIGHAGRKASTMAPWCSRGTMNALGKKAYSVALPSDGGWPGEVYGPSELPFGPEMNQPKEMSTDHVAQIVESFVAAAQRCLEAGVDVLEIHGAHGYLLHEFTSPLSNLRKDEFGGSFENRVRLPLQVVRGVRKVWENRPLFYRMSVSEYKEGPEKCAQSGEWLQWGPEQSAMLARLLKDEGVDLIDCSSGGNWKEQVIPVGPGYQLPFARHVKSAVPDVLVGAVGLITTATQAEEALQNRNCDLVLFGREVLRNSEFALDAASELGVVVQPAVQYEAAYTRQMRRR
ncbi:FMN-linked oxidoreductase [Meredithblackwellia eburnea MCA 4105]